MSKNRTTRRRTKRCTKIKHATLEAATEHAERANADIKARLGTIAHRLTRERPYKCDSCGFYHVGRKSTNGLRFGAGGRLDKFL